jgi:hypothetical protein
MTYGGTSPRPGAGRLRTKEANNHGGSWSARLVLDISGTVALRSGGFGFQGEAPNKVKYQIDGRLRNGVVSGRLRLTYLKLDFIGFDDSYLCDSGTTSYRARRG